MIRHWPYSCFILGTMLLCIVAPTLCDAPEPPLVQRHPRVGLHSSTLATPSPSGSHRPREDMPAFGDGGPADTIPANGAAVTSQSPDADSSLLVHSTSTASPFLPHPALTPSGIPHESGLVDVDATPSFPFPPSPTHWTDRLSIDISSRDWLLSARRHATVCHLTSLAHKAVVYKLELSEMFVTIPRPSFVRDVFGARPGTCGDMELAPFLYFLLVLSFSGHSVHILRCQNFHWRHFLMKTMKLLSSLFQRNPNGMYILMIITFYEQPGMHMHVCDLLILINYFLKFRKLLFCAFQIFSI